jgi:hypothetical protein
MEYQMLTYFDNITFPGLLFPQVVIPFLCCQYLTETSPQWEGGGRLLILLVPGLQHMFELKLHRVSKPGY